MMMMMMMQYVGCNRSNTHNEALTMGSRHQLQFNLAFFGSSCFSDRKHDAVH